MSINETASESVIWLLGYVQKLGDRLLDATKGDELDLSQDCMKVVRHEKRFRHFLTGQDAEVTPITFEIWPSLTCDARCRWCTYRINHAKKGSGSAQGLEIASVPTMKRLLEELVRAGVCSVIWTGGGEPTMHPRLLELVEAGRKVGLEWGMFTHGVRLEPGLSESLLNAGPRFLRVSVNAGSEEKHNREFGLGIGAYEIAKRNVTLISRLSLQSRRCIGIGYALSANVSNVELEGIMNFVSEVFERSGGGLAFVAFRPRVLYYRQKLPVAIQPGRSKMRDLVFRISNYIVQPLRLRFGSELRIDFKAGMFLRLAEASAPCRSLATGWAGAMDHLGRGYVLSELNGSPWANACYGDFTEAPFQEIWLGKERLALLQKYAAGELLAPAHHKLSHVDEMLSTIRAKVGVLSNQEVDEFYNRLKFHNIVWPRNWDFL